MTEEDIKECQAQARFAERMAESSIREKDKAAWLDIAQRWQRMVRPYREVSLIEAK